ncbi:GNAT family N-acetyltransferase [Oceanobacillus profundus]|uniref:lipid II:glycine glycyltransferase FemX n=1 Tax=Oceanobacillus profundus TaxID=372463 RepID=UPI002041BFB4|nr:GNAT family N-acetyltransferase [Oceanobacillus profundus]MCM3399460.1 GNAT family N-acetyltransferase [Oceanobacillus profundus]
MLSFISAKEEEKWNEIVSSFKDYDTYYLLEYTKGFQTHGDGEPLLIYFEDSSIRAMNVVMKRDISSDKRFQGKIPANSYFDITTPYGYGGFLIEGIATSENIGNLKEEYTVACKNNGIISEFVRFHPVLNNNKLLGDIYDIDILGNTITMNLETKEQVWKEITGKNRNVIRKAIKSGVEIYWGRSKELFETFVDLYNATMDKDNATDYYYFKDDFFNSILNDLRYNSLLFYAVFNGKIIAMSIIMFSNGQMHYHLSASDKNFQHLAPTNLLLYEASIWGCENGCKTFHLGGGLGSEEDSLYKFKKAFNKNSNTYFSIGRKIFNKDSYDKLISIRKNENIFDENSAFFPLYRS